MSNTLRLPMIIRNPEDLERAQRLSNGAYNLSRADLRGANLQGVNLERAYLRNADLRGANLKGTNLEKANLQNANLKPQIVGDNEYVITNLQGANLRKARLVDANLQTANLQGAILNGAFLLDTDLRNANLQDANLDNTNIRGAKLDGAILNNTSMRPSLFRRMANILPPPIILNINPSREEQQPLAYIHNDPWSQDEDCVGEEDPVSMDSIPIGRGFRLEAENRCYDAETLANMKRTGISLVGPMTRIPFTEKDKKRINHYMNDNMNDNMSGGYIRDLGPNPLNIRRSRPPTRWPQDEDCVGQEDPVSMADIPPGRGFRLEAENRCYDALTLAEMRRLDRPMIGPMTRNPFTANDIRRIDEFRIANPNMRVTGGKKQKTRRKLSKKKKINKKRKTSRRI